MYLDGRREYARPASRFLAFGLVILIGISILSARLFYLQVVSGGQFESLADGNRSVLQAIPSSRGLVYDRNGVELAVSEDSVTVFAHPFLIKDPAKVAQQLAPLTELFMYPAPAKFTQVARDIGGAGEDGVGDTAPGAGERPVDAAHHRTGAEASHRRRHRRSELGRGD